MWTPRPFEGARPDYERAFISGLFIWWLRSVFMNSRSLVAGCLATMSLVWAVHAQTTPSARPQQAVPPRAVPQQAAPAAQQPRRTTPAVTPASTPTPAAVTVTLEQERAFLKQYCQACHSEAAKNAG